MIGFCRLDDKFILFQRWKTVGGRKQSYFFPWPLMDDLVYSYIYYFLGSGVFVVIFSQLDRFGIFFYT